MKTRATNSAKHGPRPFLAILILLFATPLGICIARAAGADDSANSSEDAAVKQVVAGFSDGWNTHDAHAMCSSLADDVQWVNWRGEPLGSRQAVEDEHAKLFADLYKNTHRTDDREVHSLPQPRIRRGGRLLDHDRRLQTRWIGMAISRRLANFVMAKRSGRWIVVVSHTADFNATAPAAK